VNAAITSFDLAFRSLQWRCRALAMAGMLGCGSGSSTTPATNAEGGAAGSGGSSSGAGGAGGASEVGGAIGGGGALAGAGGFGGRPSDAAASGGARVESGVGGSAPSDSGARGACKRGIATNVAPGAAFSAGIGWWYNWASRTTASSAGVEFVPMAWDENSVSAAFAAGARYLLGFNEPNFKAQANLTADQAAAQWRTLENNSSAAVPLVSPAVNFCGPAANCNGTDPYAYLKAFFAACTDCRVDYVAVHWYNCDVPSLRDYLEPGGSLEGFEQFGKPIWVTEFACSIGGDTSVAGQEAYMRAAIPYLESNPHVFRYSWFSADPIPNAKLVNADGTPTNLGRVYIDLAGDCH
jgi:hypothetical protein